ncbi:signal peptidase II [Schaalia sp. ZJ405]|uniref:signal peptidase II n=1 Tax=Schaalia sp. ZJ405 TaxID=2709403 RepID=UPI0013EE290D|nr:signal peptidase II [Schaalia sp. ZJ405]QPK81876.1 signal peptidase II [Schaalia sp. ZJ405]
MDNDAAHNRVSRVNGHRASDPGALNTDERTRRARTRSRHGVFGAAAGVCLLAIITDQLTKVWALDALSNGHARPLISDLLTLQLTFNSGAAFSLGGDVTWLFTVLSVVVLVALGVLVTRAQRTATILSIALLAGGAAGNLIDRAIRPPGFGVGHVVDFINYNGWFVGNVADIWIVLGAILVAWFFATEHETREPEPDDALSGPLSNDQ